MPELPEISARAAQIKKELTGKTIQSIDVLQPKCLNIAPEEFQHNLVGAAIQDAFNRGKWIFIQTSCGWLLLNLGMGGEMLLVPSGSLPEKRRLVFHFTDNTSLSINFWWFGYAHYMPADALDQHGQTAHLGPNALEIEEADLAKLLAGQRGRLKTILLDQNQIAGIGNAYIHDILFLARLHPLRAANSLSAEELHALYQAIHAGLQPSLDQGGAFYEVDLFGQKGGFSMDQILIGYREGSPCPNCATPIEKIKTGSTSSFLCPHCQPKPD
jgi:formamidopyrimidine-DNA glycosylase